MVTLLACVEAEQPRQGAAAVFALPEDGTIIGSLSLVEIEADVTLYDVARHFDLGMPEVQRANPGARPWTLGSGQRILIPTQFILPPKPWVGIVINLAARRLYYFPNRSAAGPKTVLTYPIGIGDEAWPTPTGRGAIIAKTANPSWSPPIAIREEHASRGEVLPDLVPPGPNNPMGLFKLQTSFPSIYLHGTNHPWSVGDRASHGCIRLYPEDVADLFRRVPVGTPIRVIDAPYLFGTTPGRLYLSAYGQPSGPSLQSAVAAFTQVQDDARRMIDWGRLEAAVKASTGLPEAVSRFSSGKTLPEPAPRVLPYRFPAYGENANNASEPVQPGP